MHCKPKAKCFCPTMICCIVYIFLLISLTGAAESGIVGGREAKPHSRPYMVSVQYQGDHKCGGILIQRDFVLTAAHCKIYETYAVVLGAHYITEEEKSQQHIEVAEYYPHPGFTGQFEYDIMLLKLKKKATLNKYVKTIGLPKRNGKTSANMECVVAGWGWTTARDCPSNVLKEATESIESTSNCENIWQQYFNSDHMICTNFTKQSGGVCQGDSGGPLICKKKLQGITAYTSAEDCNDPKYPHVFTKVSVFIPWIKETMKK